MTSPPSLRKAAQLLLGCTLLFVSRARSQQTIPNIDYVGKGYDILYGNPRPSTDSTDEGWQSNVFAQDHSAGRVVNLDGEDWLVPEDYEPSSCKRCSVEFQTSDLMSAGDYQASLSVDVKANFKGWGASFKASAGYREVSEGSRSRNTQVIESTAKCIIYCISVTDNATPRITDNFAGAVRNLPDQYDRVSYMNFISDFGTHYAKRVTLGVLTGTRIEITSSAYQSLRESDIDVSVAASYKGMGYKVSGEASFGLSETQQNTFDSALTSEKRYLYGGSFFTPNTGDSTIELAQRWYNESKSSPLPLSFELEQLSTLLTTETFPEEPLINRKRRNLLTALNAYCLHLDENNDFDIECVSSEYEVQSHGSFGGEPTGFIRGNEFSDHKEWDAMGLPMMKKLDMYFDPSLDGQPLTGVTAHYYKGKDSVTTFSYHGQSGATSSLELGEVLGRNEREYITSVEVCTYPSINFVGMPTRRIGQLTFETNANREQTQTFRGKDVLYYVNRQLTWQEAVANCVELGGELVSAVNDATHTEVGDFALEALNELGNPAGHDEIWLYITDFSQEGTLVWGDDTARPTRRFPSPDMNRDSYDCVQRDLTKEVESWAWADCSERRYSVCRAPEAHDFECAQLNFTSRLGLLFLSGTETRAAAAHVSYTVTVLRELETLTFHSYLEHTIVEDPLVDDVFDSRASSATKFSEQMLTSTSAFILILAMSLV